MTIELMIRAKEKKKPQSKSAVNLFGLKPEFQPVTILIKSTVYF
jgi:hypothetical protein